MVTISSTQPCLILYLLDQSGSMAEAFANGQTKAKKLADSINEIIFETGLQCVGDNGDIKNRFEIGVVGYGSTVGEVSSAWQGNLNGRWAVPISEVFNNNISEENNVPVWINPIAGQDTPTKKAFENAYRICNDWINWGNHRDCHPPIVINITDGVHTDCSDNELRNQAQLLKSLSTNYGNLILMNVHISAAGGDAILFPNTANNFNQSAQLMFEISSELNQSMQLTAKNKGYDIRSGARGYVYNASGKNLVDFLEIGSRPGVFDA